MQDGKGASGMAKKVKGLSSTNRSLQNDQGDIKYSIGNIVINIVITTNGVRWVMDSSG